VFLGNGDGTFNPRTDYAVGPGAVTVAAADLNGDGFLDLVAANSAAGMVSVLLQQPPDPTVLIGGVISEVSNLNLGQGQTNSLTSKLQAAEQSLAKGNDNAAIKQLDAFINQVLALERSHRLDSATADGLIADTEAIIALI
jgi:hypothetical protein